MSTMQPPIRRSFEFGAFQVGTYNLVDVGDLGLEDGNGVTN